MMNRFSYMYHYLTQPLFLIVINVSSAENLRTLDHVFIRVLYSQWYRRVYIWTSYCSTTSEGERFSAIGGSFHCLLKEPQILKMFLDYGLVVVAVLISCLILQNVPISNVDSSGLYNNPCSLSFILFNSIAYT